MDAVIVGGFSSYIAEHSMAVDNPFLLYRNNIFCDVPGLYRNFVDPSMPYVESDIEAPPFVCYVMKQLLHNSGYSSEMIFYLDFEQDRMANILKDSCHVVLLSTTLLVTKSQVRKAVNIIREYAPEKIIVAGGPFINRSWIVRNKIINEENELYYPCADDHLFMEDSSEDALDINLYIIGDHSLTTAMQVIDYLKEGKSIDNVTRHLPNCAQLKNAKWEFSTRIEAETPIMPIIDWSIFRKDEMRLSVPMIRSKGCPFRCRFCNFQSIAKYQEKEMDVIHGEISSLIEHHHSQVRFIYFCDDNFCGSGKSMHAFTDLFIEQGAPFKWITMFDARYLDDYLAEKLRKAGCILLKIGMESADDRILKNMGKPCRVSHYKQAVSSLAKVGISIDGYFFVGFPGETQETVQTTIENLNSFQLPAHSANQFIFFAFLLAPLAPIFELKNRQKYNITGYMRNWKHDTMDFETAVKWIPEIIKQTTAMQPLHGNIEKMLVPNTEVLAAIDKTRGDLIRQRLINGKEDAVSWDKLRKLVGNLKLIKTKDNIPLKFV